ncbi:MAG TPA: metallophosphoesterase [Planctomycetota bacterium]|jgi:hypothetical protein
MVPSGFLFILVTVLLPLGAFGVMALRAWGAIRRRLFRRSPPGPLVAAAEWRPLGMVAIAYAALFTAAAAWAFLVEPDWIRVEKTRMDVSRPLLGRAVLRILHVSDLHLDEPGARERALVECARREKPDLVLLTGDYVNRREAIPDLVQLLRDLKAPRGVFGVEGHHDHKFRVAEAFEEAGATLLRDEFIQLRGDGRPVVIAGLAMHPSRTVAEVLKTAPEDSFRIVLHHTEGPAERLRPGEADLYLCGHTHGGQIRIPFLGPLLPLWRSDGLIPEGESRQAGAVVVVNRGLGMTGGPLPRARLFSRPEIRLIEIVAK